jgi:hypothetical protein
LFWDVQLPLDPIGFNRRLHAAVTREIMEEAWILRLNQDIVILIIGLVNIASLAWPHDPWQSGKHEAIFDVS